MVEINSYFCPISSVNNRCVGVFVCVLLFFLVKRSGNCCQGAFWCKHTMLFNQLNNWLKDNKEMHLLKPSTFILPCSCHQVLPKHGVACLPYQWSPMIWSSSPQWTCPSPGPLLWRIVWIRCIKLKCSHILVIGCFLKWFSLHLKNSTFTMKHYSKIITKVTIKRNPWLYKHKLMCTHVSI